jgi:hypothetical protein
MLVEESAIQLVDLPELWPPIDRVPAASGTQPDPNYGKPLPVEPGPALPRQFAVLLAEVLAGVRPERQLTPWLSKRGSLHLHRLMPLFTTGHQPKVLRVLTTRPTPEAVEMTIIAVIGPRPRALAVRLEYGAQPGRWLCTDIESA